MPSLLLLLLLTTAARSTVGAQRGSGLSGAAAGTASDFLRVSETRRNEATKNDKRIVQRSTIKT